MIFSFINIYIPIINLIAFFVYGIDKRKAAKNRFRIKEATLFLLAILGGAVACGLSFSLQLIGAKALPATVRFARR